MYRISELGELVGLSRTTLLYYEKLGLIQGKRMSNGYRTYSEMDLQRLRLIQQLQSGGLTLKECKACLEAKVERQLLLERLNQLDQEIAQKQQSRDLLAALLGEKPLTDWHEMLDKVAPDAHIDWLIKQGFSELEAQRLRWLSKDMNTHDSYMADFNKIFTKLDRWGPGSEEDTLAALKQVKHEPISVLEIGCGQGIATTVLAQNLGTKIYALDNHETSLERLMQRAKENGVADRVVPINGSMQELPFEAEQFDLIWAEGCAYIMGVKNALKYWREFLSENGVLVISDLVWATETPSDEVEKFWSSEYPDMMTAKARIEQAVQLGYTVLDSFPISKQAWRNYFMPLQARVNDLKGEMSGSQAINDIQTELDIYHSKLEEFDYQMYILTKA